jgi:hypothetical protein
LEDREQAQELCKSCNRLPKRICVNGLFTGYKVYIKEGKFMPDIIAYNYTIDDDSG